MQFHMMTLFDVLGKIYRGYLLFGGEYQIHFIECVENFDVFNSRDEIYLVFTKKKKKKKKNFLFYTFLEDLDLQLINLLTMLQDKGVFVTEYLDQST